MPTVWGLATMTSIRDQLEPFIREHGLRQTAREADISPCQHCAWLKGRGNRRMGDEQLARLAAAAGATIVINPSGTATPKPRKQ